MPERILNNSDRDQVMTSIELVRKMRQVVLKGYYIEGSGFFPQSRTGKQEILSQAEAVAQSTSRLFISTITDSSIPESRDNLHEVNSRLTSFMDQPAYSYSGRDAYISLDCLEGLAQDLSANWGAAINKYFVIRNNIRLPVREILSTNLGIIAPLTTDLFHAMLAREFIISQIQPETFSLRSAAVQPNSGYVVFDRDRDAIDPYSSKEAIAFYTDVSTTGLTASTLSRSVRRTYPNKIIFSPRIPGDL